MAKLAVDTQSSVWGAAPGTDEGTLVGRNATSEVGFFGTTPIPRPVLASGATGPQIVAALTALGLVQPT